MTTDLEASDLKLLDQRGMNGLRRRSTPFTWHHWRTWRCYGPLLRAVHLSNKPGKPFECLCRTWERPGGNGGSISQVDSKFQKISKGVHGGQRIWALPLPI